MKFLQMKKLLNIFIVFTLSSFIILLCLSFFGVVKTSGEIVHFDFGDHKVYVILSSEKFLIPDTPGWDYNKWGPIVVSYVD